METPPLTGDLAVDVCVVGAGIAGLTTAYELTRRGLRVAVLERGAVGGGETGRTSAHLASAVDDRFYILERVHGEEGARTVARSHAAAIDAIEATCDREGIACGFARVDGYLFAVPGDEDVLERELPAARRAGLVEAAFVDRAPLAGFDTGRCIRFPRQAQFDPAMYISGLARALLRRGGSIHTGAHVVDVTGGAGAAVVTAAGQRVRAGSIVVATNVPINDRVVLQTKLEPHRSYVIALRIPRGSVPSALYWDTGDPYHYVRVVAGTDPQADVLLVGGEDHPTGQAEDHGQRYAALATWTRMRFPGAGGILASWSGQIIETVDGLAYSGRNPADADNVYVHAGDSGNGLTHGTLGGMLIADLITRGSSPWEEVYRPSRISLRAAGEFAAHNAAVAAQYADWLRAGDVADLADIAPGRGAVVRQGLHLVAAYRDPAGTIHACSAACPHLGGVVRWNAGEKTWDCPCHGSRFDAYGTVRNGPANADLTALPTAVPAR